MFAVAEFFSLVFIFALLGAVVWWLRRHGGAGLAKGRPLRDRLIQVVESRPLGPGQVLYLVRVADRMMLIATHGGGCTLLETRPWPEIAS